MQEENNMNWMQKDAQTSAQMEIAWQCAPVLTGVKPSNILTLKNVSAVSYTHLTLPTIA